MWQTICAACGLVVGYGITYFLFNSKFSKIRQALQAEESQSKANANEIIEEAKKQGEKLKRDYLMQVKEELHKAKVQLDQEIKNEKDNFAKERNRLEQKETNLDRKLEQSEQKKVQLDARDKQLTERETKLQALEAEREVALQEVASLSLEEAKQQVLEIAEKRYYRDMAIMYKRMEDEMKEKADEQARSIVVTAIQRYASDFVSETTVSVIDLPNDEMKGRIIGREGRNIRSFEAITGVDIIIDDTPGAVVISCFNPVRREIAKLTLEKLIQDGRIHPTRIEEMYEKSAREIDQIIVKAGDEAAFETGIIGMAPEVRHYLGRLKYRTSYGQNVLQHCIEVSKLAGMMAADLGLDVDMAKRAGLLHDVGKSCDFEIEGTHVELGVEIAKKYKEPDIVVNAIAAHHGDCEPKSEIAVLVMAADAISAARPGARRENLETYVKRIEKLEKLTESFEGVSKAYAIQAGREIRVIVNPEMVDDAEMALKAHEICQKIEEELAYPGQIKVSMIRETRAVDYAR
ncbi:ribonuclease Y [Amygdalobacter nucleatus]|uniref:ribonuclease Y n=1 Tax=Amygdalobacter nucleatus TaxID=3029274 RepID=UPI0027A818A9|nr:ribonuclease Y [Amygdalobacter nucleatus]WEG36598.1 ribonuclease Y [Amygdalobacter nucleatus]